MPEQNLIINHKKITYHGIFRTDDFFNVLNAALAEKGYTKPIQKLIPKQVSIKLVSYSAPIKGVILKKYKKLLRVVNYRG